jgi:hypothetical protein
MLRGPHKIRMEESLDRELNQTLGKCPLLRFSSCLVYNVIQEGPMTLTKSVREKASG